MDEGLETEPSSNYSRLVTTCVLIVCTLTLFVIWQVYIYTFYWRKGIPGPRPLPIIGNSLKMTGGFLPKITEWRKQYGKTLGLFNGMNSMLVTSDIELTRLILTKEFPSFQARDSGAVKVRYLEDALTAQSGAAWKRSRSYLSPAFSASKLKQMIPALNSRCDVLLHVLEKKHEEGEGFETKPLLMPYVLDCIASCAFGIEAHCQTDPEDSFIKHASSIFDDLFKNVAFMVAMLFPRLSPLVKRLGFEFFPKESMDFFANIVKRVVELRKEGDTTKVKDFIQLMIDAASINEDNGEMKDVAKDSRITKKSPLTPNELLGQSMIFFLAGFDTISTTTGFMLYAIANYPEIQTRLLEEIDEMAPEGHPVGYDAVFKMEYLDKVWLESMRLWPIGFALTRYCNKDFTHKDVHISAGENVMINVWDIQHDPEYWPEPDKFDPERFNKDVKDSRHPCAYMPFGLGPRNCVGMRFAILESKLVIIRILQKYRLELLPETEDLSDVSTLGYPSSIYPTKGIHIRHVPRN